MVACDGVGARRSSAVRAHDRIEGRAVRAAGGGGCCGGGRHANATGTVFVFQAEDGIRDLTVTGVQTCALPICTVRSAVGLFDVGHMGEFEVEGPKALGALQLLTTNDVAALQPGHVQYSVLCYTNEIGRASCRERV